MAVGTESVAGEEGTAVGWSSEASGISATAVGAAAAASGSESTAIGFASSASGDLSTAIGHAAGASGRFGTALGQMSRGSGANSTALGSRSLATHESSIALGYESVTDRASSVSVGNDTLKRTITNVGAGAVNATSSDAVTGAQLHATDQKADAALAAAGDAIYLSNEGSGSPASATGTSSFAAGGGSIAAGSYSTALGQGSTVGIGVTYGTAIGYRAEAGAFNANAVGTHSVALGSGSIALGSFSRVEAAAGQAMALGTGSFAAEQGSIAVGTDSDVLAGVGVALGMFSRVEVGANGAVALGYQSVADQASTVSIGAPGRERRIVNVANGTSDTDAVTFGQLNSAISGLGAGSTLLAQDPSSGLITFGAHADGNSVDFANNADSARRLTGVADGDVTAGSTDAVTGGQLFDVQGRIDQAFAGLGTTSSALVASLGGGASFGAGGAFIPPSFLVQGTSYANVAAAFERLDQQVTINSGNIAVLQGSGGGSPLVRQSMADGPITVGATAGGNVVNVEGTDGARRLTGVGDGAIASGSSDAVTGSQVHAAQQSIASALGGRARVSADGLITDLSYKIGNHAYSDVASAFGSLDATITGMQRQIESLQTGGGSSPYLSASTTAAGAAATGSESLALGGGAQATGAYSTAAGSAATAAADRSSAFGAGAQATQIGATAVGAGAVASYANSTAIGAGAATSRASQIAIGTGSSTYSLAGIASEESRAAQSGPVQVVTSDAGGNLATADLSSFFPDIGGLEDRIGSLENYAAESRQEARQGIAAAMAMTVAPMPSAPGKTSWATNIAAFKGEVAFGASLAHRFDVDVPFAMTAGFAYGGGDNHGVRVGLAGEF